jgi:ArsR family transcriptional regulator
MPATLPTVDTSQPLCCAPLGSADFDPQLDPVAVAARLRSLSDANRIRIVQELSCCEGHHLTTSEVARSLGVTDATASHHLKQLTKAGLLESQRDGSHVNYRLNIESMRAISGVLNVGCGAACACS